MEATVLTTAPPKPAPLTKSAQINGQPFAIVPGETLRKPTVFLK